MNVVLYTSDFEPITVLDLPLWLLEQMEKQGAIRVAVMEPPSIEMLEQPPSMHHPQVITIFCEKLRWRDGTLKTILVTPHEELALSLRPEWLPGQRQAINHYKKAVSHLTQQLIRVMRKN